ncbi:MAG: RHS repeat-associated core domain-containing protein [Jatrophihabitantaceae bacterium]
MWLAGLTASALAGGLIVAAAPPATAAGGASLDLTKTVSSASAAPTMAATLSVDRSTAIPGDELTYTARVTNTGAVVTLNGAYSAAEGTDSAGTLTDWYEEVEYHDVATKAWVSLGGYQATSSGWTPVAPSPSSTGLTVDTTPTAAAGVTYPSTGDHLLGTVIGAGKKATWSYTAQLTLAAAQVSLLSDPKRTDAVRNVVHVEVSPRDPKNGQPYTYRAEFANPFGTAGTPITGVSVAFTLPDGSTRTVGQAGVPALASIPTGGSVDVPTKWTVPTVAPPGTNEADAAYLSRLAAVEGTTLTAKATATGTGAGSTRTASTDPVSTVEHLPIVSVGKSGPTTIEAGDTGNYQLPLQNTGGAGAAGIALTDTVPAGGTATVSGTPASLAAGGSATATAAFPVPGSQPDGPLTDTAQVRWTDANGNPYGPVSASFTTDVQSSLAGATLTLAPDSAGPDVVGTSQVLTATLLDRNGQPMPNIAITLSVSGTNSVSGTVTTGASGTAAFHYAGQAAGLDTAQAAAIAGTAHIQSNTAQIGWVSPIAPIGTTSVDGRFFTESTSATTFVAKPGDTPTFGQSFPNLAFNPSAAALPHNQTGVGPSTHPFTDVTTDIMGNGVGSIVAQGNGKQAGGTGMTSFDAVFTADFVVAKPGDVTFRFDYDAGFLFGVGGGASRVNGSYENTPASNASAFEGYPLAGADNRPNSAVHTTTVTVHFPSAGSYPYEVDYTESGGPTLSLVLSTVSFTADTSGVTAYVSYADGLRPGGSSFPFPWSGSPNTVFVGCQGSCQFDGGAVRLDNTTGHAVTINSLTVDIGPNCQFAIWPHDRLLPDGQTAIFTQTISGADSGCPKNGSFDTSDAPFITCSPTHITPHITFTIDGETHSFDDSDQILNTKGIDPPSCGAGNETHPWTRIGGDGVGINTPLPPAGSVVLSPLSGGDAKVTSVQADAGTAQSFRVDVLDASGLPVGNAPVDLAITGAHPGHVLGTTGADGTTELSYNAFSAGDDSVQVTSFISGMRTFSGVISVHWALPAGTVPDPANPGQTLPATPPVITEPTPADGTRVTAPVPVKAAVTPPDGETITSWTVSYQAASPGSPKVTLASGSGAPPATLATFDPTVLANDTYTVTVSATSSGGGVQSSATTVAVDGNLKLGRYLATYKDVDLPVNGLPMQVLRSYDSTDPRVGDFGVGWQVSVGNFRISANRILGAGGWTEYPTQCSFFGCSYAFKSSVQHTVTVTFPDQHQEKFDFTPSGGFSAFYFLGAAAFTAVPGSGTTSTLEALDNEISYDFAGNIDEGLFGDLYAPTRFKLTTRDGRAFILDTGTGLVSETDPNGNSVSVDGSGVHASTGESITFVKDVTGRITKVTEPGGQAIDYSYSVAGDLAGVHYPDGFTIGYSYDAAHHLTGTTGSGGRAISAVEYDAAGRVAAITDGSGNRTVLADDVAGRQQTVTSPSGRLTTVSTFDDQGDVIRQDQVAGGVTRTTTSTYDAIGHLLSSTDPLGHTASANYDSAGDLTSATDGAGHTTRFDYDDAGHVLTRTEPDGTVTSTLGYDGHGNLTTIRQADGSTTTYSRDSAGRLLSITDADGRTASRTYAAGHLSSVTDPLGNRTDIGVDGDGRITSMTDPLGTTVAMAYDAVGNLVSITDPSGNVQRQTFDGLDNITSNTDGLGRTTTNVYDGASRLLSSAASDGTAVSYGYDADGNLVSKSVDGGDSSSYSYDPFGELIGAVDGTARVAFGFDTAGNLVSEKSSGGSQPTVEHSYRYDAAGQRIGSSGPEGDLSYGYNATGLLQTLTDYNGQTFQFAYNRNGQLTGLQRPNGVTDTLGYTAAGQLTARDASTAGGASVGKADYTLDGDGRRASATDLTGTTSYSYDAVGQLLTASHPEGSGLPAESYSYDRSGNRTGADANYDAAQQLTQDAGRSYSYDAQGDVLSSTDRTTGAVSRYSWDAEHKLRGVTLPDGSTVDYGYDALGRRVVQSHGAQTVHYGYDGQVVTAEYDAANAITASYLDAPTPDAQLEVNRGGQAYYPTVDGLGTITGLTNASGALVQRNAYDSFGNRTSSGADLDPYAFTGKRADSLTGLYDYGLRQYDPSLGRFTSPDPLPSTSLYSYVDSNPVNLTDPSGAQELIEETEVEAETAALLEQGDADVTVYYAKNVEGNCYFGITKDFETRMAQHEAAGKNFVETVNLELKLTRNQARVVEQRLINEGGGAVSSGGKLVNKINSIAQGGPLWNIVLNTSISFLDITATLASSGCP